MSLRTAVWLIACHVIFQTTDPVLKWFTLFPKARGTLYSSVPTAAGLTISDLRRYLHSFWVHLQLMPPLWHSISEIHAAAAAQHKWTCESPHGFCMGGGNERHHWAGLHLQRCHPSGSHGNSCKCTQKAFKCLLSSLLTCISAAVQGKCLPSSLVRAVAASGGGGSERHWWTSLHLIDPS